MTDTRKCADCRRWDSTRLEGRFDANNPERAAWGQCKFTAPTNKWDFKGSWPLTHQDDWCEEFVLRLDLEEDIPF